MRDLAGSNQMRNADERNTLQLELFMGIRIGRSAVAEIPSQERVTAIAL